MRDDKTFQSTTGIDRYGTPLLTLISASEVGDMGCVASGSEIETRVTALSSN